MTLRQQIRLMKRLFWALIIVFIFLAAVGCAVSTETEIPVAVRSTPPAALTAPVDAPLPRFISPADPSATSALSAEGEDMLKKLIHELVARLRAWEAWAGESP